MEKVIATYKIEYPHKGIVQYKNLISHFDYLSIIKPAMSVITDLEIAQNKKNKKETEEKIYSIKKSLKQQFSDNWFTDKSPLYEAIESGVIFNHKCKLTKI